MAARTISLRTLLLSCTAALAVGALGATAAQAWVMGSTLGKAKAHLVETSESYERFRVVMAAYQGDPVVEEHRGSQLWARTATQARLRQLAASEALLYTWAKEDHAKGLIRDATPVESLSPRGQQLRDAFMAERAAGHPSLPTIAPEVALGLAISHPGGWASDTGVLYAISHEAWWAQYPWASRGYAITVVDGMAQCVLTMGLSDGCGGLFWHRVLLGSADPSPVSGTWPLAWTMVSDRVHQ